MVLLYFYGWLIDKKNKIIEISPDLSPGVLAEVGALSAMKALEMWRNTTSAENYIKTGLSLAPYEYEHLLRDVPIGARILDVGVGVGQSAVFLADKGYEVVAVEPAVALCELLRDAAECHNLNITVVQGVAEHLSRIGRSDFNVVIFNSSLHHCDDSLLALAEARKCLHKAGCVYLVNENMLKPWQTLAGFQRRLIEDPVGMGHYGGNEHAYRNGLYIEMLKSQFQKVELKVPRNGSAIDDLKVLLERNIDGVPMYTRSLACFCVFCSIFFDRSYGECLAYIPCWEGLV